MITRIKPTAKERPGPTLVCPPNVESLGGAAPPQPDRRSFARRLVDAGAVDFRGRQVGALFALTVRFDDDCLASAIASDPDVACDRILVLRRHGLGEELSELERAVMRSVIDLDPEPDTLEAAIQRVADQARRAVT